MKPNANIQIFMDDAATVDDDVAFWVWQQQTRFIINWAQQELQEVGQDIVDYKSNGVLQSRIKLQLLYKGTWTGLVVLYKGKDKWTAHPFNWLGLATTLILLKIIVTGPSMLTTSYIAI